jgi:hypothetical protein
MMILVNDVIKTTIEGSIVRTDIRTRICSDNPYSDPESFAVIKVRAGPNSAALADSPRAHKKKAKNTLTGIVTAG